MGTVLNFFFFLCKSLGESKPVVHNFQVNHDRNVFCLHEHLNLTSSFMIESDLYAKMFNLSYFKCKL